METHPEEIAEEDREDGIGDEAGVAKEVHIPRGIRGAACLRVHR